MKYIISIASILIFTFSNAQTIEKAMFNVKFAFVKGGQAEFTKKDTVYNNEPAYYIKACGYSTGFVDFCYKVKEVHESYINQLTMLPYKAIRNVQNGSYKDVKTLYFYQDEKIVEIFKGKSKKKCSIPSNCYDLVSSIYRVREIASANLKYNDTVKVDGFLIDTIFNFKFIFKGTQDIFNGKQKINCLRFMPIMQTRSIFKSQNALHFWISNDEKKLPLLVVGEMKLGNIKVILKEYNEEKFDIYIPELEFKVE